MSKKYFESNILDDGDEFYLPEVGAWSLEKWRLLGRYLDIFTKSMSKKWKLVYIDLYSGSGLAKIKNTNRVYRSSALLALSLPVKFSKYIFCDSDQSSIDALRARVERRYPNADCTYIVDDANNSIDIIDQIVSGFKGNEGVLPFAFIDPFEMNFMFSSMQKLVNLPSLNGRLDILMLKALQMDLKRGHLNYLSNENNKVDDFIGDPEWREQYDSEKHNPKNFVRFIADQYILRMRSMGYRTDVDHFYEIKNQERNQSLYYLVYYSKHPLGYNFQKIAEKGTSSQTKLDF